MLIQDGIPTEEDLASVLPPVERRGKCAYAITECFQNIPCNPCMTACVKGALKVSPDINARPKINYDICNGCSACIARCPGLAIFVIDSTAGDGTALIKMPYEFLPVPAKGDKVTGLDRTGQPVGTFPVESVVSGGKKNLTWIVGIRVPENLAMTVRAIRVGGEPYEC
jgi:Fe-S-cluster-containing hydrogenase component 2